MSNEWSNRYLRRDRKGKIIRRALRARVFGPYEGDCSYILSAAADRVQLEDDYTVELCLDVPEVDPLASFDSDQNKPRYNLEASLECLQQADYAVFVFMRAKERRFRKYGPREAGSFSVGNYFEETEIPQDLNSSVVLEFSKWLNSDPRCDKCMVIYENNMKTRLGSLIHGLADREGVFCTEINTEFRGETIRKISRAIASQCKFWEDRYRSDLESRVAPFYDS